MSGLHLKLAPSEVDDNNPWGDDKLDRGRYARTLTELVNGTGAPLVLTLNGAWGSGKTFFLKRWQAELEKCGHTTIYFSAWEDDYCEDPQIALIGQFWEKLQNSKWHELGDAIKDNAGTLFRQAVFKGLALSTGGVLDFKEESFQSDADKMVAAYAGMRKKTEELKKRMSDIAANVIKQGAAEDGKSRSLVVIIDELDRCRPTFAVELLEVIKHLFNVHGIVFMLGVDRCQLAHSVRSVYGQDMDADGYLRRFIDLEFILPSADPRQYFNVYWERCALDAHCFQVKDYIQNNKEEAFESFGKCCAYLCACMGLSLRDVEYVLRLFVLACERSGKDVPGHPHLLAALILLKVKRTDYYSGFVEGRLSAAFIVDYLRTLVKAYDLVNPSSPEFVEDMLNRIECALCATDTERNYLEHTDFLKSVVNGTAQQCSDNLPKHMSGASVDHCRAMLGSILAARPRNGARKYLASVVQKIDIGGAMIGLS